MVGQSRQQNGRLFYGVGSGLWIRHNPKKAGFGKGAKPPIEAGSIKPLHYHSMMNVRGLH